MIANLDGDVRAALEKALAARPDPAAAATLRSLVERLSGPFAMSVAHLRRLRATHALRLAR